MGDVRWSPSLYPDLYTPTSPSWSLHWTYRDSQLVNLPVSLLVEGDIIALRPGQEAFASLRGIKVKKHSGSAAVTLVVTAILCAVLYLLSLFYEKLEGISYLP